LDLLCPRTGKKLRTILIGGVAIEFSEACGGAFFDRHELERFDDAVERPGDQLAELMNRHRVSGLDFAKRLRCPKDPDVVMMRRFYSPKRGVEVDECPACGGLWMDAGELAAARVERPDDAAARQHTKELLAEVMGTRLLAEHKKEQEDVEETTRRIRKVFGFFTLG
jgi:uncharacterized protein